MTRINQHARCMKFFWMLPHLGSFRKWVTCTVRVLVPIRLLRLRLFGVTVHSFPVLLLHTLSQFRAFE